MKTSDHAARVDDPFVSAFAVFSEAARALAQEMLSLHRAAGIEPLVRALRRRQPTRPAGAR